MRAGDSSPSISARSRTAAAAAATKKLKTRLEGADMSLSSNVFELGALDNILLSAVFDGNDDDIEVPSTKW